MIRIRIEHRKDAPRLTWMEIKEVVGDTFLLMSALVFLFFSVLLATRDRVIIASDFGHFEVFVVVIAVGFVALGIDRLVSH